MVDNYDEEYLTTFPEIPGKPTLLNESNERIDSKDILPGAIQTENIGETAIGGWTLTETTLTNGTGSNTVGLDTGGTNPFIYGGSSTPASAPFRAYHDGQFVASNATITGTITATAGAIGGWIINSTSIADSATAADANVLIDSANTLIRLGPTSGNYITLDGANQYLQSSNYVSGVTGEGFYLDSDLLEVGNVAVRGIIRSAVFQKDVVSAIGGNLFVRPADVLATDMTALDASTLTVSGSETFAVGDFLRIKDTTNDEWLEVTNAGSAPTYTVTRDKGADYTANANPAWNKGATVVNYGASGEGGIYLTSSESNAPYMSVFTHAGSPWDTITTRLRVGNLNGYLDYSTDIYGFAVGSSSDYISVDPTNNLRIVTSGEDAITVNQGGSILLSEGGDIKFSTVIAPSACTATLVTTAGNVDAGNHVYKVTFVTSDGETELGTVSNTVTNDASNQQNSLTGIPTSSSSSVIARRIYRNKVSGGLLFLYLLTTINDNTTTTYTDNTADASLGIQGDRKPNTASGSITLDGTQTIKFDSLSISMGYGAYESSNNGFGNVAIGTYALSSATIVTNTIAIGSDAGQSLEDGYENTIVGDSAMVSSVSDYYNVAIGSGALYVCDGGVNNIGIGRFGGGRITTGDQNVFIGTDTGATTGSNSVGIGYYAMNDATTANNCVAIGSGALQFPLTSADNVVIGYQAARSNTGDNCVIIGSSAGYDGDGSGNIFIGYQSGYNETGSNKLYIENSNSATPLIYGDFSSDYVTINGYFNIAGASLNHDAAVAADWTIENKDQDKDIIFKVNDGGSSTEAFRIVGADSQLLFPNSTQGYLEWKNSTGTAFPILGVGSTNEVILKSVLDGATASSQTHYTFNDSTAEALVEIATSTSWGSIIRAKGANSLSGTFAAYNSGNTKCIIISHDGTDGNIGIYGGGDIKATANFVVTDGNILQVNSAGDDKNIQIYHDDTNAQITCSGDLYIEPAGLDISFRNGTKLGIMSAGNDKYIQIYHDDTNAHMVISSGNFIITAPLDIAFDAGGGDIKPVSSGSGSTNLGTSTQYWNDVSYKTITDRGCLGFFDDGVEMPDGNIYSDLTALTMIKKREDGKETVYGKTMLDYKSFPIVSYKKADEKGELLPRDKNDEPIGGADGIEMTSMFSIFIGAFKEISKRLDEIDKVLNK